MTHFNSNLHLPIRTGPSPMEDAIVQQVEWYMGRLNLEKDDYLKHQMDDDLWVSLDVILNFPKMQRMGVQDKRRVATLLHARSTIVEVDEKSSRIRPAWARRSTIVIHDVPPSARLDQVAALFSIPTNALANPPVPPPVSAPPGLISIQPAADTIWLAIFDSPTGAQESLHLLLDKDINGQKINPEVHLESPLRPNSDTPRHYQTPSVDSPQPNSPTYSQVNPIMSPGVMTNQMLNPMGMPMPVIHHPTQDPHQQYSYPPPPATYAPAYPQNMPVPRQFMGAPRAIPAGYVMTYPQAGHPYDPSHPVTMQPHPIRPQQQQLDQNAAPIIPSSSISAEGATTSQPIQTIPTVPNGPTPPPAPRETIEPVDPAPEFVQDPSITQVQADAQRIAAQIPFTAPMQIPVMTAQPIDGQMMMAGQVKPVDMHYMHRPQIMGDPNVYNRGNGRQSSMGRDRNSQRNTDGGMRPTGRGSMMDGQRGSTMHRKGKKGNRGSTRHGHAHDRDRRDGKGDGSGSDTGNRDDRKYEKSKPEPNLASMHFPPLPMSENAGPRAPTPKIVKKDEPEDKPPQAPATPSTSEPKEVVSNGPMEPPVQDEPKVEPTRVEGETASPAPETSEKKKESCTEEQAEPKEPKADVGGNEANAAVQEKSESKEVAPIAEAEKKPEPKAPAVAPTSSPMSYAAILRSKKPGPPPRPTPPPVSRSSSGASGKNGDSTSGSEANSSGPPPHPPKEKSGRRRKSNNQRNNHTGDTNDNNSAPTSNKSEKNAEKKANDSATPTEAKDSKSGGSDNTRSKPVVENTRAHPVWVNKPKSLFQPASAAPTVRPSTPQVSGDSKKTTSPVSSQGDEKEAASEKAAKDGVDRSAPNGQPNGDMSANTTKEESNDVSTNSAVETKDVVEVSTSKVVKSTSKTSGGDATKKGKAPKGAEKTASFSAKGAWAAGGPKTWPKNNGNGVMEKASNPSES